MKRQSIKLIKQREREPGRRATVKPANPNRWSSAVRSWVVEFRHRDQNETLPAFDSLFNDPLPESGSTE